jgi:hypothetical protein
MKTKREVLKTFITEGSCGDIKCIECPYLNVRCKFPSTIQDSLARIGAMTILRMFPEKREFDPDKILTCVTADKAKVGMKGYFGDNIASLRTKLEKGGQISELIEILDEKNWCRFRYSKGIVYALFYPINEEEE